MYKVSGFGNFFLSIITEVDFEIFQFIDEPSEMGWRGSGMCRHKDGII